MPGTYDSSPQAESSMSSSGAGPSTVKKLLADESVMSRVRKIRAALERAKRAADEGLGALGEVEGKLEASASTGQKLPRKTRELPPSLTKHRGKRTGNSSKISLSSGEVLRPVSSKQTKRRRWVKDDDHPTSYVISDDETDKDAPGDEPAAAAKGKEWGRQMEKLKDGLDAAVDATQTFTGTNATHSFLRTFDDGDIVDPADFDNGSVLDDEERFTTGEKEYWINPDTLETYFVDYIPPLAQEAQSLDVSDRARVLSFLRGIYQYLRSEVVDIDSCNRLWSVVNTALTDAQTTDFGPFFDDEDPLYTSLVSVLETRLKDALRSSVTRKCNHAACSHEGFRKLQRMLT